MSYNVVDGSISASSSTSTDAAVTNKSLHVNGKLNCQINRTFNHHSTEKKTIFLKDWDLPGASQKFSKNKSKSDNNRGINLKK